MLWTQETFLCVSHSASRALTNYWGKHQHLKEIGDSLGGLLEETRKTASKLAKSRPTPSDDSASRSNHKRLISASRSDVSIAPPPAVDVETPSMADSSSTLRFALRGLVALLHLIRSAAALGLDALLVCIHCALGVLLRKQRTRETWPGFCVAGIVHNSYTCVRFGKFMPALGGLRRGSIGKVD